MRRRVPYVPQMELTDCGAACLAMVLAYHGKHVPFQEVRDASSTGRDGVNAHALTEAARHFGLSARGVRTEVDDLAALPRASILHWGLDHFVVLDAVTRKGAWIVDPAAGRLWVSRQALGQSYTGIALLFETTERFTPVATGSRPTMRYLRLMRRQSPTVVQIVIASLLIRVFALALPLLTAVVIDGVIPNADRHLLWVVAAALAVVVAYFVLANFLRAHLLLRLRARLDLEMTLGFVDHLVDLPYGFFLTRSSGDLVMRMGSTAMVREMLTTAALSAMLDGAFATLYLALLITVSVPLGLLVAALGALQVGVLVLARRRSQRLMASELQIEARSQNYAYQLLAGIETLKAAGAERRASERWSNLFVEEVNVAIARGRLSAVVDTAMGMLRLASPLAVLVLGTWLVVDGQLEVGAMLAVAALATGYLEPLASLVRSGLDVQLVGSYLARVNDVLDAPREQADRTVAAAGQLEGSIRAEHLTFAYSALGPPVLKDVSIQVEPGQQVALVGPSGSGKSTLARLLLGLYEPTSGRVLFDGVDAADLDARSVRRQLGVVTQDAYLFGMTIRENIELASPDATEDDVVNAARLACIHDDIVAMPMGYDTPLIDRGASLSGGQRQRIALARALVHQPRILLLDEATSALDATNERRIYKNLGRLGCTIIQVAHRLSTVVDADQIFVLDAGHIAEHGTHAQLLRARGSYYDLVAPQGSDRGRGAPGRTSHTSRTTRAGGALIDVNSAGVDELVTLPGVGRVVAERIIAERESNGPFRALSDLARVEGFGAARIERMAQQARAGRPARR